MDTLGQDIRQALRALLRNPGFAIAALVAPTLGIGVNTATFSVVNAVLLRPLPYPEPERVLGVWATAPDRGLDLTQVSYQRFAAMAEANRSFEALGAFTGDTVTFTGSDEPRQWTALRCSSGLLDALRVRPILGRNFRAAEDERGGGAVVILTHELWRRQFGSDRDIVGRPLAVDGSTLVVIGVLPADFTLPGHAFDVLVPRVFEPTFLTPGAVERGSTYLDLVARLKPGVTERQAQAELDVLARNDERSAFLDAGFGYRALPFAEAATRGMRPTLLILLGAVGLILLMACANVANLLLARAVGRERDTAVRAALGATRWRLVVQFLVESVVLGLGAGVLGVGMAAWGLRFLVAAAAESVPRATEIRLDGTVLGVAAVAAVATGLLFGLVPALQASRVDLAHTLKQARGGSRDRRSALLRNGLVVAEIAISVVLLIGAGLLLRSLERVRSVSPGFDPGQVLVARISLPRTRYAEPAQIRDFYRRLEQDVATLPGVLSTACAESLPLEGSGSQTLVAIEGRPLPDLGARPVVSFDTVTPGYFRTLRIPLLEGRGFNDQDDSTVPIRVVVARRFGDRFFPGESPVGRHVLLGKSPASYEIVGVVGDVRHESLTAMPVEFFYLSANQRALSAATIVTRTAGALPALGPAVRQRVRAIDATLAVTHLRTMDEVMGASIGDRRLTLRLLALFAALAFALAATGIYGLMAFAVSQRTGEIGVRVALGAGTRDVLGMVLRQGLGLSMVGVGIGLVAALGVTRAIAGLLYGVTALDPVTFGVVALLLTAVALAASLVPARRAARVDPMVALRRE